MKTRSFLFGTLTFFISVNFLIGQEKTEYSTVQLLQTYAYGDVAASSYYMDETYVFTFNEWIIMSIISVDENGDIHERLGIYENDIYGSYIRLSSCVYDLDLYTFLFYRDQSQHSKLKYFQNCQNVSYKEGEISLNEPITKQIATVTFNDTIYLFFVDDTDSYVKYYEIVNSEEQSKLVLVNDTPTILNSDYKAIGGISAITYVNDSLEEQIMVSYPGEVDNESNNKINIYSGKPGNFNLFAQKSSMSGCHVNQIAMAQGSVKGGSANSYNIQFGYNIANHLHNAPCRSELNLKLTPSVIGNYLIAQVR